MDVKSRDGSDALTIPSVPKPASNDAARTRRSSNDSILSFRIDGPPLRRRFRWRDNLGSFMVRSYKGIKGNK